LNIIKRTFKIVQNDIIPLEQTLETAKHFKTILRGFSVKNTI